MHKFLSKFIVIAAIVNLFIGIVAIGLSDIALAQDPETEINPDGTQQVKKEDFHHFCRIWATNFDYGDYFIDYEAAGPEVIYIYEGKRYTWSQLSIEKNKKYQEQVKLCLDSPENFINQNMENFDLNMIIKQGKQVLPTESPRFIHFPEVPGTESLKPAEGIPELIAFVYLVGLWLVGAAVFVQITGGGVRWLLAAGKPGEIEKAKTQITNAIFGLILLLSSFVILNTINPDLVNGIFDLPPIGTGGLPR